MEEIKKWKCDICNTGFNNFHAQGFDNKIYCPLCYFKHEYNSVQSKLSQIRQHCEEKIKELDEQDYFLEESENYHNGYVNAYQEILTLIDEVK